MNHEEIDHEINAKLLEYKTKVDDFLEKSKNLRKNYTNLVKKEKFQENDSYEGRHNFIDKQESEITGIKNAVDNSISIAMDINEKYLQIIEILNDARKIINNKKIGTLENATAKVIAYSGIHTNDPIQKSVFLSYLNEVPNSRSRGGKNSKKNTTKKYKRKNHNKK